LDAAAFRSGVGYLISNVLLLSALLASAAGQAMTTQSAPLPANAHSKPAELKRFTAEDLVRLKRLTDPQVSPDGRYVAFVLRETDMEANRGRTDIWLLDLTQKTALPRRLTQSDAEEISPRWGPDSRTLYFLSTRSGQSQVWRLTLMGGEAARVTDYPVAISSLKVSPTGERIAISMDVFPDCADLRCTKDRLAANEKSKATGRLYDHLFIRHWDTWSDGTRSHLFVARVNADGKADTPIDVSKSLDADVPAKPFGSDEELAFSPDGTWLVFSARIAGRSEPWSTNFDLYQVPVDHLAQPKNLTQANPAWDTQPVFLKNGDLAWLAMDRPGFESDRFHVMLREAKTGTTRALTQSWDRSVSRLGATPDGRRLLATAEDLGQLALFWIDPANGTPHKLVGSGHVGSFAATNESIVFAWETLGSPADLFSVATSAAGTPHRLTKVNEELLGRRVLSPFEQFNFKGWNDETVYGYVVKPYGFEPGKRYPIAFLVHGGPQQSFGNYWTYRWNAQALAGAGFALVMVDFHGSQGYGQAFTDSISGDWGGKPLVDLQKGLEAATSRYAWLDAGRACALGASYGGYMMNWIEGNWPDRFRCIVNHDGTLDARFNYYSTEELWFEEWEHGGPQYEKPPAYEKFNPVNFVSKWHTPMLVVHGEQDFRIPYAQGIATFTALQRRGIESRLLIFPNENHWVLQPADSLQWYQTVIGWLKEHLDK
jgi:dipeptidyl aminopeptidase/acylaminoacyl peptidase